MSDFPESFEKRMRQSLHGEWESFLAVHQTPSPVSIRINPFKNHLTTELPKVPWAQYGRYLPERPVFTLDPTFHAGSYYVQEASSMFLEQVFHQFIDTKEKLTVLDLCAAPGGKSTHLASLINADSLLVSNEVIRSRASILAENLQKWGTNNVVVTNNDPEDFSDLTGLFDVIVVDAPCSGEGLFRKDPDAMKEWSEDNVQLCSKRQQRILHDIWPALKENGILIYSTCTYNALENEENLQWLKTEKEVEFLSLNIDPAWNVLTIEENGTKGYRFYPHRVNGEGFFLSVIRKKEPEGTVRIKPQKNGFTSPSKKILEKIQSWVKSPEGKTFIQRDDLVQFFPASQTPTIELLVKSLRIVTAGTFLGTVKHEKVIPEHALAISLQLDVDQFPKLAVSVDEAIQYLKKENINLPSEQKGFSLITFNSLPLGWVNVLDNRINNMYPSEWRIRMK
ncbi:MAG TPA: rRNA methyltransferase [Ohtaekwangia sp.]